MKKPSFQVRKRRVIFSKGPIHLVDCSIRLLDGKVQSRQILEHPGAVVIIPKTRSGKFILIRQFRFAAKDWLWEFPAGGIEKGESLKRAASRELVEETGFKPGLLRYLLHFFPTPGVSGEIMHLFLAKDLKPAHGVCDEDEEIETGVFSLDQIGRMIRQGKIIDGKTMLGYWCLKSRLSPRLRAR